MTEIERIREAVRVLSTLTDAQWEKMDKLISITSNELKEETKLETKQISYDEQVKQATELLKLAGVPTHIKGYGYLREAILLMMNNPKKYSSSITKILYPDVAQKFNTTGSKVERGIRHAIKVAWNRGDPEKHQKILGYTVSTKSGIPTNFEAISGFAEYIKMYMMK